MTTGTSIEVWHPSAPRFLTQPGHLGLRSRRVHQKPLYGQDRNAFDASGLPLTLELGRPIVRSTPRPIALVLKRALDVVLATIGIAVLSPLLVLLAAAVKATSPGPALFRQPRTGLGGRPFEIIKFRSMYAEQCDPAGLVQTGRSDPRITPLGRFMRRHNLDELPQLFNVLKGEMSLVGPRPHIENMVAAGIAYEKLVPWYRLRETIKPGLSGWAQVNGYRGDTSDPERARARIDHDLAYIENFSLLLDIRIIARTLLREMWKGSGT